MFFSANNGSSPAALQEDERNDSKILEALQDFRFGWRTVAGIAKDTGLDQSIIEKRLAELGQRGLVVQTGNPKNGVVVFTTRKHYKDTHNFFQLAVSAITNNIIY